MLREEISEQVDLLFEGGAPEYPHTRLKAAHALDFTYMDSPSWEGSSGHRYTRLCGASDDALNTLTRNSDIPVRLMMSAVRLLADSIIEYSGSEKREGDIRYYPAIVLTFWSGFETFVKHASELFLLTVKDIPSPVRHCLQETEEVFGENGTIRRRTRYQSILHRYAVFMSYAYTHRVDRAHRIWQNLEKAKQLRDYYTHLDMNEPRSITTKDVMEFVENTLLGLIWPSSLLQRTLLIGQYHVYNTWVELKQMADEYRERPLFLDWHSEEPKLFHCNFENVDTTTYPSVRDPDYSQAFKTQVDEWRGKSAGDDLL
jgi:hypothetical protein